MANKATICITEKEYRKARLTFEAANDFNCVPVSCDEGTLAQMIREREAMGVVLGVERFEGALYEALPKGGVIARFGVGHDGLDKEKATQAGLYITNTPAVLDDSVAEHTMWLLGGLAKKVAFQHHDIKSGLWQPLLGSEVKGKVLLILGCGKIGSLVARIASRGFGMRVIGYDVAAVDEEQMREEYGYEAVTNELAGWLGKADYVSLHLPSLPATRHIVNQEFLVKMKFTACLINTARGSLVDEAMLYDALVWKKIAGAALDVYDSEPYEPVEAGKDLRRLPQVLLTPHTASSSEEASARMAARCLDNMRAVREQQWGQLDLVNREVMDA